MHARLAVRGHGLEREFAPAQELLGEHRALRTGAHAAGGGPGRLHRLHAVGRACAHARRRLHHHGEPDLRGEGSHVGLAMEEAVARHRQARPGERGLHAALVAETVGDHRSRAGNVEVLAGLRELHHQRLEDADDAVHSTVAPLQDRRGVDDVPGREWLGDANEVVVEPRVLSLGRRVHHAEEAHARQARGRSHEAHGDIGREGGDEDHVTQHAGESLCDRRFARPVIASRPCASSFWLPPSRTR